MMRLPYEVDKLYDHTLGMSTCFRQPGAASHCKDPHGYPLAFRLKFGAQVLDPNHWVLDFGGLKPVKAWLADTFDHRTCLAKDDPALADFQELYAKWGFREILVLPFVGCEGFAIHVFNYVDKWLYDVHAAATQDRGLRLLEVEVREHAGNSATFRNC